MSHTPVGGGLFIAPLIELEVVSPRKVRVDEWIVEDPDACRITKIHFRLVRMSQLSDGREWVTRPMP